MEDDARKDKYKVTAWVVWLVSVIFYLYEYLVRVAPSVMEQELEVALQATPAALAGALGAYYFVYAPVQLLAGVLLDRFGGRRVLIPASLLVVLGCLFIVLPSVTLCSIAVGRFFMGLGSGFGFIGVMYLAAVWFHPEKLALISGLTTSSGILGALIGQIPLSHLTDVVGWRSAWIYIAFAGVIVTLLLMICIPKTPVWERKKLEARNEDFALKNLSSGLWAVCKNRQTWIIGFVACALYTPFVVFGDLWGVQYVRLVADITKQDAACVVGMFYIGWLIGSPLSGYIADRMGCRRRLLICGSFLSSIILGVIFLLPICSPFLLALLLFACGVVSSPQVVCFVCSLDVNPAFAKGSAIAVVNMIVMLVGGIFQPIIGWLIHANGGAYDAHSFRCAMLLLPLLVISGFFTAFFMRSDRA
ncbi:MAG: MFS transporter [Opitutales bacterium]|nr:MFS transporter [Opitutales bacterium]